MWTQKTFGLVSIFQREYILYEGLFFFKPINRALLQINYGNAIWKKKNHTSITCLYIYIQKRADMYKQKSYSFCLKIFSHNTGTITQNSLFYKKNSWIKIVFLVLVINLDLPLTWLKLFGNIWAKTFKVFLFDFCKESWGNFLFIRSCCIPIKNCIPFFWGSMWHIFFWGTL